MEARAKLVGHPIHQMLIVFPLGLLGTAAIFDGVRTITKNRKWSIAGHYMIGTGVVSGLAAAVPGLVDYLAIPKKTRARRIGLLHGIGNVLVTGLFAASWVRRRRNPGRPNAAAIALSTSGMALALVTGWLGGELVDRLAVGVDEGAHVDAPSSLTHSELDAAA